MKDEIALFLRELIKNEMSEMKELLNQVDSNIDKLNKRLDKIESKISVNTYLLEKVNVDVNAAKEVQDAHMKQSERFHEELMKNEYCKI